MQVTIEEINGKQYTVVWYTKPRYVAESEWDKVRLRCGTLVLLECWTGEHEATALPSLPRNPKPSDAWLLHLYAWHGLMVEGNKWLGEGNCAATFGGITSSLLAGHGEDGSLEITHALHNGERCEIAIGGE